MDYFKHYDLLMMKARNRTLFGYKESHHIIPKCLGGSNFPDNLVDLLPEEHYIAHQLLVKMYPNHPGLLSAAMMMSANRSGNKVYGWLRKRWSEKMKTDNPIRKNPSCNAKKGRRYKGTFSAEERSKISARMKTSNPMAGKKPWEHSRSTKETKDIWLKADLYYDFWLSNPCSYHKLATNFGMEPKMSHNNMIKRFRNGWIPRKDAGWLNFYESCKI